MGRKKRKHQLNSATEINNIQGKPQQPEKKKTRKRNKNRRRTTTHPNQVGFANDGIEEYQVCNSWLPNVHWLTNKHETPSEHICLASSHKDEIQSLQTQLNDIKKQLWPAVMDRCTSDKTTSPQEMFEQARRKCNPYEELGEGDHGGLNKMFVNRSAMKLANIDALLHHHLLKGTKFVDLCGAPGGFSEYILFRGHDRVIKGWGMSLNGSNAHGNGTPWKINIHNLKSGMYRICTGKDGTGDILLIVKPILSRPASAERYVVCAGYRSGDASRILSWRDEILKMSQDEDATSICIPSPLQQYLDDVDHRILELNIHACHDILECLKSQGKDSAIFSKECKYPPVDMDLYKKAWKLSDSSSSFYAKEQFSIAKNPFVIRFIL